ncbi:MAG TPA: DUF4157 domain-containing protein [Polyangia bacterium]
MAMGTEDDKKIHRRAEAHGEGETRDPERDAGDDFEEKLRFAQLGGGAPLAGPLAAFMESRFGTSFRRVRVHVGAAGAALARSVRARAFTVGRHIFFGPGAYRPHTEQGRRLIAHELTHVMQQRGGLHSVQREVEATAPPANSKGFAEDSRQAAKDAAAPETIPFERFMKAFNLREGDTPPQVMEIIKELVERALHHLPQAEKLLPLLQPLRSTEQLVRRVLRSRSHELRLETARVTGTQGQKTKWELRFFDRTRADALGGRVPGGTDSDDIDVGDTGRPSEPAEPGADLKEALKKKPAPAAATAAAQAGPDATEAEAVAAKEAAAAKDAAAAKGATEAAQEAAARTAEAAATVAAPVGAAPEEPGPVEAAAAIPGAPAAGAVSAAAKTAAKAAEEKIPQRPEDDPNFKAVVRGADRAKKQSAAHGKPGTTALNAEEAAPVDDAEKKQLKQGKQVDQMSVQATPGLEVEDLVTAIEKKVAEKTPQTLEKARNFKNDGTVGEIGRDVRTAVGGETDKTRTPLKAATDADPAKLAVTPRTAQDLAPAPIGARPKDIDAGRAIPPAQPASQVEGAIEQNKQAVDAQMKEVGVPETTLRAATDEPPVAALVGAKDTFDADAAAAPAEFRKAEAAERAGAKKDSAEAGVKSLGGMFDARAGLLGKVQKGQHGGKTKSESQHDRIKRKVNEIYERTRDSVHKRLETMQKTAFDTFDKQSKAALSDFENAVVDAEKRWNDKNFFARQGNRFVTWLNGLPNDLERDLGVIRRFFIGRMKQIVRDIAQMAARELKAAKQEVKDARAEVDEKVATLKGDQKALKDELTKDFGGRFDALEGDINKAREAFVSGMGARYRTVQSTIETRLSEVQERNKGFFAKLKDKAVAFIGSLDEMKEKLKSVFKRAGLAILRIAYDPKRFMKNLFSGIQQGFEGFATRIKDHLVKGAVEWLTGTVASAGVVLPSRPFTPEKVLALFLQLAGLTIENVKLRARLIWGDKVVDAIEKGVAGAEAAMELFDLFKKEGVVGVVRRLFDKIKAFGDQALEKIKDAIQAEIVKKAIEFLLTLLTPIGALIQAVITIVNTVLFLIRNAGRIQALINTIVDSVNDVLAGNVSGVAKKVEAALALLIPITLDFLATLAKVSSTIVKVVKEVLGFIRKPVEMAIDFMLKGIKNLIGPFIARVMGGFGARPAQPAAPAATAGAPATRPTVPTARPTVPGARPAPGAHPAPAPHKPPASATAPVPVGSTVPFTLDSEQHTLFVRETADDAELLVSSSPKTIRALLAQHGHTNTPQGQRVQQLADDAQRAARRAKRFFRANPMQRAQFNQLDVGVNTLELQLAAALRSLALGEGPPGTANFQTDSLGRPLLMTADLTPFFVARNPGSKPGFFPPGWPVGFDGFFKGTRFGRGHLLAKSLGGDGNRRGNLATMEQDFVNSSRFGNNERVLRQAIKSGQSVAYVVSASYDDSVKLEDGSVAPDPIPDEFRIAVTPSVIRPLGPFTTANLHISDDERPLINTGRIFTRITNHLGPRDAEIRADRAAVFKATGQ